MQLCPECGAVLADNAAEGACPKCFLLLGFRMPTAEATSKEESDASISLLEKCGDRIDDFKLLEVIGEGAFGTVWMAEQKEPVRRKVALKIIKPGMDTRAVVARFEAERQALAMMDHPNIAQVFDGGATENGRPYFVMELVRGVPLTEFCDARKLSTRERIELFITVCEAVQHAHQKGIIHRDLKPSNILVTEQDGRLVPKVIDFGIAKAIEQRLTDKTLFTQFNQFMGTPAYMSPEQTGLGLDIDTRSDVYSLGVLLYELITGRTPFDTHKLMQAGLEGAQRIIRETEPSRPSARLSTLALEELAAVAGRRSEAVHSLSRMVRGEIDWIALKALDKDRTRRYQSASDLAADLRRYLDNEPISARPPSGLYRLQKLARRNKLLVGSAAGVAAVLIAGLITTTWQFIEARRNLAQSRLNAYASDINLAQEAVAANNQGRAVELLERHRPKPGDVGAFEWRYLWNLARSNDLATFSGNESAVAFSPDGTLLASTSEGNIVIRDASSFRVVTNLSATVHSLSFSPRDKVLAGGGDKSVRLWSTETWREIRPPIEGVGYPARFSPDGAWLITSASPYSPDPKHHLWRTDTWESVASCLGMPESWIMWQFRNAVAFSPDGTRVVTPWLETAAGICGLRLWKVPSLELVENIYPDELPAWSAAFHPDGRHLLIGTFYGELAIWDLQKRTIVQKEKEHQSALNTIAVAPGAKVFATTREGVTLWDARTFRVLARFRGHRAAVWASALSPDGKCVVTGASDGTVKVWDGTARDSDYFSDHGSLIAGFTPDSRTLVLAPRVDDPRWHLFSPAHSTIEVSVEPPFRWDFIHRPYDIFGEIPIGVLGRTDGTVELWNLASGKQTVSWRAHWNAVTVTSFSPDGSRLASGSGTGQVKLWNVSTGEEMAMLETATAPAEHWAISKLVFSPNGRTLAGCRSPSPSGEVVLWDLTSKRRWRSLNGPGVSITTVAFSPNGHLLATAGMTSSEVFLWDLPSGRQRNALKGHVSGIVEVAFTPDGRTLATAGYDSVKLWNLATAQEVASLSFRGGLRSLCFSPNGRALAVSYVTYPGHHVRLHQAPSLEEIAMERKRMPIAQP